MHSKEPADIIDCGDEAGAWLSRYIKGEESGLRLGYHDAKLKDRKIDTKAIGLKKFYPYLKNEDMVYNIHILTKFSILKIFYNFFNC